MALESTFAVTTTVISCRLRLGLFQRPLRFLLNITGGRLPLSFFPFFHAASPLPAVLPDLIISAGGHTSFANAWLGRALRRPNLFCGRCRGLDDSLFAGIVTAYPRPNTDPRYIFSPTPVAVDRAELAAQALVFREKSALPDTRLWSLLVGGDGAGYRYTKTDWIALAEALRQLSQIHAIRWVVTTSRRSGPEAEAVLSAHLAPPVLAAVAFVHGEKQITYQQILGVAERHFCTEDSHMMISEAIATGRPVHTVRPAHFKTDPTNRHFLDIYTKAGLITAYDIATLGQARFESSHHSPDETASMMTELSFKLNAWWRQVRPDTHSR